MPAVPWTPPIDQTTLQRRGSKGCGIKVFRGQKARNHYHDQDHYVLEEAGRRGSGEKEHRSRVEVRSSCPETLLT